MHIEKLHYYCSKVLPLVYNDTLSYYENVCKVVERLNEIVDVVNEIPNYIDNYIDEKLTDEHLKELILEAIGYLEGAISSKNEKDNTNFSTDYSTNELLWWKDTLYKIKRNVNAGDTILETGVNPNVEKVTFEELFNNFITYIKDMFTTNDEGGNTVASRDFSIGEFLWINDKFYVVTKAITE